MILAPSRWKMIRLPAFDWATKVFCHSRALFFSGTPCESSAAGSGTVRYLAVFGVIVAPNSCTAAIVEPPIWPVIVSNVLPLTSTLSTIDCTIAPLRLDSVLVVVPPGHAPP